ncbi:hypothetical protein F4703DRAFT_1878722 [Phycomyces blakesleeanus]
MYIFVISFCLFLCMFLSFLVSIDFVLLLIIMVGKYSKTSPTTIIPSFLLSISISLSLFL